MLDQELGVAPLEETTQLYNTIKENRLAAPAGQPPAATAVSTSNAALALAPVLPPASAPASAVDRDPPLVGRTAEWGALLGAYRAIGADGRLVVLEGEAGIGKTRLADAALQLLRGQATVTLVARCYEGELNLAYGPFVEALRAALGHTPETVARVAALAPHWLSEAARLLPELHTLRPDLPPPPPSDSPGAQSRFFEAVRQVLLAVLSQPAPPGQPARPAPC